MVKPKTPTTRPGLSYASAQGTRSEQQDRYLCSYIQKDKQQGIGGQVLAVMDGHAARETAEILARDLQLLFEKSLEESRGHIEAAIRKTFENLVERTQNQPSGSTLSMVYIPDDEKVAYMA